MLIQFGILIMVGNWWPEYPHNVVINLKGEETFQAFSYTPRQQGEETNGNIQGYELWVYNGPVGDDLAVDSSEWKQVAKGNFVYEGVNLFM